MEITQSLLPLQSSAVSPSLLNSTQFNTTPIAKKSAQATAMEFESMFVSTLIKEMRSTLEEGFFSKETSDTFGGMFDLYIGQHIAKSEPLGIGRAVSSYLASKDI